MKPRTNISDKGIVLARVDYGEKDRILTLLTANHGKLSAIAKSVRSPKSKLAGGIELFAENNLVLVSGKTDLFTVTSSRMEQYFSDIVHDIEKAHFAYDCLKNVNKLALDESAKEYYPFLLLLLKALNHKDVDVLQLKIWFNLKLLHLIGVSPNLQTLSDDQPLPAGETFNFDIDRQCFVVHPDGRYTENHIKILRYLNNKTDFKAINDCPKQLRGEANRLVEILLKEYV